MLPLFRWEAARLDATVSTHEFAAAGQRDAPRLPEGRRVLRRCLLHGRKDDGHLLPPVLHGQEAASRERRVLRVTEGSGVLRLQALQALPPARVGRAAARMGRQTAAATRHRPGRTPARLRAARGRHRPGTGTSLFPQALRHDFPGVLPGTTARRCLSSDQGGNPGEQCSRGGGIRVRERVPGRVRARLRRGAGHRERRSRRSRLDSLAGGPAGSRRHGGRNLSARVQ